MIETFDQHLPGGITLACRAAGAGKARVLLLHGFPEAAFIWDEVMARLALQARCVAPNLRGYAGSSAPPEQAAYRPKLLVGDVVQLIEALGAPIDVLVAHDWGGALAWNLAAQRPDLLRKLVMINSPHPATFMRELRASPAQQEASTYMNFFCRPDAEALLSENDFARLWPFFGNAAWMTDVLRAQYRAAWNRGLIGPLNYYRNSPLRPSTLPGDALNTLVIPDEAVTVKVPTTVLWGELDHALLPGLLAGLGRWVPDLRLVRVADASHWIVHEQPARVAVEIERALAA
jgi:pimeloyl-ACP methyl ester carboxylesterase